MPKQSEVEATPKQQDVATPNQQEVVTLEPLAVKRTTAADLLDCGPTTIWKLEKAGKLDTITVGKKDRRITMASLRRLARGSST